MSTIESTLMIYYIFIFVLIVFAKVWKSHEYCHFYSWSLSFISWHLFRYISLILLSSTIIFPWLHLILIKSLSLIYLFRFVVVWTWFAARLTYLLGSKSWHTRSANILSELLIGIKIEMVALSNDYSFIIDWQLKCFTFVGISQKASSFHSLLNINRSLYK